jgi:hypothetical protein
VGIPEGECLKPQYQSVAPPGEGEGY